MDTKNRKFVTITDAAEILGCYPRTLRRAITEGRLRAYKLGAHYRLDINDVVAFLDPVETPTRDKAEAK